MQLVAYGQTDVYLSGNPYKIEVEKESTKDLSKYAYDYTVEKESTKDLSKYAYKKKKKKQT